MSTDMHKSSTLASAGLCAGLLASAALTASAAWTLNDARTQLTDGNWTLTVAVESEEDKTLVLKGRASDQRALDLTDVEADTGYRVVAVADASKTGQVFYGSAITSLSAPDLVRIGASAFRGCTRLQTVTPATFAHVETIGEHAFRGDGILEGDLDFPRLTAVADHAFENDARITSLRAPSAIRIGTEAFPGCNLLTNVEVGVALAEIGANAFYLGGNQCKKLEAFRGATNLVSIGASAFRGCTALKVFAPTTLPKLVSLGEYAFHVAPLLEGDFSFPSLTAVAKYAFNADSAATSISSIHAPNVASVGERAFFNCTALSNVVIRGGGALGANCLRGIKPGADVRFTGEAPASIGATALVPVGSNPAYIRVLVSHARHLDGWEGKYTALTDGDRARADYPGRRTKGRVKNNADTAMAWLVDADHAKQTIFSVQ